jgi:hypothetical protein
MHKWLHLNFDHERGVINDTSTKTANVDSDRESHTCTTLQYLLTQSCEKWNTSSTQTVHFHSLGTREFTYRKLSRSFGKRNKLQRIF